MEADDFLKASYTTAENTVRAYDTKAQITLIAHVILFGSLNLLAGKLSTVAELAHAQTWLFFPFILSVALLIFVLAPTTNAARRALKDQSFSSTYFVQAPYLVDIANWDDRIRASNLQHVMMSEIAILHYIRITKHRRFRLALFFVFSYLAAVTCVAAYATFKSLQQG